jgi:hypothetical protein
MYCLSRVRRLLPACTACLYCRARGTSTLRYIQAGSDPTTVAVMMEDGGAVAGLLIASERF